MNSPLIPDGLGSGAVRATYYRYSGRLQSTLIFERSLVMYRVLIFLLIAGVSGACNASKSALDCEAEVGEVHGDSSRRAAVAKCLLDAATASSPGQSSATDSSSSTLPSNGPHPSHVVQAFGIEEVNSAGGVELEARFVNPNKMSSIKYIRLQVTPYNAVGDVVRTRIGDHSTTWIRATGPIRSGEEPEWRGWNPVWYNATTECVKINAVEVEYMDGKKRMYTAKALKEVLSPEIKNDCRPR
ncbi:hypothetical protein EZ313_22135 [Ramlibacter henchirensis]|uniref:Uncharacterized protein n=1 Tax=Ramlibacter henchirensis TaxID=204072 RepID=A0A4Z0BIV8_9BURK|nr:hypothetical protein [Ramlibacter henchirensis]TFY99265.1 hypothetical protein EZ313_22135 [Ramlibacter henchirensis]